MAKFFRAICGGDSFEKKKPDPNGALAIVKKLGCRRRKQQWWAIPMWIYKQRRNAGMVAMGVTYGFGSMTAICPADVYVD